MKLNLKLLKRLYLIDHPSGEEHDMISFILNYCYKIPNLVFSIDSKRNLFITKTTTETAGYACILAHMDTVHSFTSARELVLNGDVITAKYIKSGIQCGLNADDCNGILVALQMLEAVPNLKVCFTTEEEVGGEGAYVASDNIDFFMDVRYMIQADRHGNSDLITYTNGISSASNEFVADISEITTKYGYKEASGTFTDVGVIAKELCISGVNISCGYYNEHTYKESCNIRELSKCLNYIYSIINALSSEDYNYYTIPKQKTYSNYSSIYTKYIDSPVEESLPCDSCNNMDCMNCRYDFYGSKWATI